MSKAPGNKVRSKKLRLSMNLVSRSFTGTLRLEHPVYHVYGYAIGCILLSLQNNYTWIHINMHIEQQKKNNEGPAIQRQILF
jgi:hypothetical protein